MTRLLTFFLCLAVFLVRGWDRLRFPGFWGEESDYLQDAFGFGFTHLFHPYWGHFHVLQKTVTGAAAAFVPVDYLPLTTMGFCFIVAAFCLSFVAHAQFRWLIRSDLLRASLAISLCLLSPFGEMLGNLPNINWMLTFWLALLALKDPNRDFTYSELGIAIVILLSTGTFVLLLPAFIFRVYSQRNFGRKPVRTIFFLGLALVVFLLMQFGRPAPLLSPWGMLFHFYHTGVRFTFQTFVYEPFLGPVFATGIRDYRVLDYGLRLLVLAGLFASWRRWRPPYRKLLFLVIGGILLWPPVNWAAREGTLIHFGQIPSIENYWDKRYAFPSMIFGVLFWTIVLNDLASRWQMTKYVIPFFLALNVLFTSSYFWIPRYGNLPHWEKSLENLEGTLKRGCPPFTVVPVFPPGLNFRVDAKTPTC